MKCITFYYFIYIITLFKIYFIKVLSYAVFVFAQGFKKDILFRLFCSFEIACYSLLTATNLICLIKAVEYFVKLCVHDLINIHELSLYHFVMSQSEHCLHHNSDAHPC